eukprot:tig00020934_g16105.t1
MASTGGTRAEEAVGQEDARCSKVAWRARAFLDSIAEFFGRLADLARRWRGGEDSNAPDALSESPFDILSDDILSCIFCFLDPELDLINVAIACQRFREPAMYALRIHKEELEFQCRELRINRLAARILRRTRIEDNGVSCLRRLLEARRTGQSTYGLAARTERRRRGAAPGGEELEGQEGGPPRTAPSAAPPPAAAAAPAGASQPLQPILEADSAGER